MTKIICDTRQQAGKHENIDRWFATHGVEYLYRKLDAGDYATDDGSSNVLVDTKKGLQEVCGNVGRDHARFAREIERANRAGCRLVILVEAGGIRSVEDVARWTNGVCRRCPHHRAHECMPPRDRCRRFRRRPMPGSTLARTMRTMERDHGCRFEFCHPRSAAMRICDLLGVRYE